MEKSDSHKVKPESKVIRVNLTLRKTVESQKVMSDVPPEDEIAPEDKPEEEITPDDKPEEETTPEDKPDEEVTPDDKPEEEITPEDKPDEEVTPDDKPEEEITPEDDLQPDDEIPAEDDLDPECEQDSHSDSDSDSSSSDSSSDSDSDFECTVCSRKIASYASYKQHLKGKNHAKAVKKKQIQKELAKKVGVSRSTLTEVNDEYSKLEDYLKNQEPYAVCEACDKEFGGPESYAMHLKSKAHKNKVVEASILEQIRDNGEINPEKLREMSKKAKRIADDVETVRPKHDDEEFECKECDKEFSGLAPYMQHLGSKSHAKQLEKKRLLHEVVREVEDSGEGNLNTLAVEDDVLVCKACITSFSGPENAMKHLKSKKHTKNLDKFLKKRAKKLEKSSRKLERSAGKESEASRSDLAGKKKDKEAKSDAVASSSME